MKVNINIKSCERLERSVYNSNYYKLPFTVNGCDVVHELRGGDEEVAYIALGVITAKEEFVIEYYLNSEDMNMNVFIFDSDHLSEKNLWT